MREAHLRSSAWPRLNLDPDLPVVFGDEYQLQQVFLNIIINAEHALRQRGTTLRVAAEKATRRMGLPFNQVAIRISNDGPPIPDDVVPRIFDPFSPPRGRMMERGWAWRSARGSSRITGGRSPW